MEWRICAIRLRLRISLLLRGVIKVLTWEVMRFCQIFRTLDVGQFQVLSENVSVSTIVISSKCYKD